MTIPGKIASFFAKVDGSYRGFIAPEELRRSIISAVGSGAIIGSVMLAIQAVIDNASAVFPHPVAASLASVILTLILDLIRRQNQGKPSESLVREDVDQGVEEVKETVSRS